MLVKLVQPRNALLPILVTLLGIVILVKPVQPQNALPGMLLPPLTMTVFNDGGIDVANPPNK